MTGTFGEYREGHFHTGIDFSTNGEVGRPVYAVADGEVYRVADSLTGFGKAIYLRHPEGRRSVYAHLDRFAGAIQTWVAHRRRGMKFRDKLDAAVAPGELAPVRKGELIGYSGESGAGLPHLHFEMRRDEETPIHPFEFLPAPTDRTAPIVSSVILTRVFEGAEDLPGRYWIDLVATDTSEYAPAYHLSPRKIIYALDHKDTKTILFDRLSYASQENKRVGLIYDLRSSGAGGRYRFRLFTGLPRPRAPSAAESPALDVSRVRGDTHVLWIRAEDNSGNATETEIGIGTPHPASPTRGEGLMFRPSEGETRQLASPDGAVECLLAPSMFYSSEAVSVWAGSSGNDFTPPHESVLPVVSACLLEPTGVPLASPAVLRFRVPVTMQIPTGKLAVYRRASLNGQPEKWSFVGALADTAAGAVSAKIDRTAFYILSDDSVAPRVSFPAAGRWSRDDEIHVVVSDRGSGMADTGGVEVDGRAHEEWYYDADRGWVRVILTRVGRGPHRLAVTVADRIGNVSRKEWTFRVR